MGKTMSCPFITDQFFCGVIVVGCIKMGHAIKVLKRLDTQSPLLAPVSGLLRHVELAYRAMVDSMHSWNQVTFPRTLGAQQY